MFLENLKGNINIIWKDTLIRRRILELHVCVMIMCGGYMLLWFLVIRLCVEKGRNIKMIPNSTVKYQVYDG